MPNSGLLTSTERESGEYGVTVTFASPSGGIMETREYAGHVWPGLRYAADYCDEHGLRILTVSTPNTILADLQGRDGSANVEASLLHQIGRGDLLYGGR